MRPLCPFQISFVSRYLLLTNDLGSSLRYAACPPKVTNAFLFPSNADHPRNFISSETFLTVAPWFSHMNLRPLEHDGRTACWGHSGPMSTVCIMSRCTTAVLCIRLRLQSTAASAYVRNRFKPDPHRVTDRVTDKEFTYLILCVPLSVLRIGRSFPSLGNVNGHKVGVVFFSDSVSVLSIVGPQPQHPHPAAPVQLKEAFSDFLQKYKSHLSPSSSKSIRQNPRGLMFNDFWEAPGHLWQPKIRHLEDAEIDAILVSSMSRWYATLGLDLCRILERWCVLAVISQGTWDATTQWSAAASISDIISI